MKSFRHVRDLCSVMLLCAFASTSWATTVRALSVEQMAARAERIIEGEIIELRTLKVGRYVFTDADIRIERCYKGDCTERIITTRRMGGTLDGVVTVVDGAPKYSVGERVMVFLEPIGRRAPSVYRATGLMQGKFRIVKSPSGEDIAWRDSDAVRLIGKQRLTALALKQIRLPDLIRKVDLALDYQGATHNKPSAR